MIKYSKHAREQMFSIGISINEVEESLKKGSKELQGEKILFHYKYFTVVTKKLNKDFFVITVMLRW
ncbi:MAG: DUF4258 domain-containing protein [Candidatus Woesearchaeota archaeon]